MGEVTVRNKKAFYRERGFGDKDILLIHGAGGSSLHWMSVEPPQQWRVLAVDLPGHVQSQGEASDSIDEYAAWVIEFIDKMSICPVLAGHSMGGAIALAVALKRPDLLKGLALVSTGARLGVAPAILELCQRGNAIAVEEMLAKWAYGPQVGLEQIRDWYRQFGQTSCDTYFADFTACNRFDERSKLGDIRLPSLIVCGSDDRLTPLKYSQFLAENIPGARIVDIPYAGHMVMLEQPALFNKAIADFCLEII